MPGIESVCGFQYPWRVVFESAWKMREHELLLKAKHTIFKIEMWWNLTNLKLRALASWVAFETPLQLRIHTPSE